MGIPTLIATNSITSAVSASVFTSGIDSTYDEYMIVFTGIVLGNQNEFMFDGSTDGGSNYNVTKTTTAFSAVHSEDDSSHAEVSYKTAKDLAQSTAGQHLTKELENHSDDGASGIIHLFSPSSTTYVKHFYARTNCHSTSNATHDLFVAGYFNTTSAINALEFKQGGGNTNSGIIQLYGIA